MYNNRTAEVHANRILYVVYISAILIMKTFVFLTLSLVSLRLFLI